MRPALLFTITFSLFLGGFLVSHSSAQSLWQRRDATFTNLIADTNARDVGDLVTIIISENTGVQNSDQRQLRKTTDNGFNFDFSAEGNTTASAGNLALSSDSNRNFGGNSAYRVEQEFVDRITAQVVDLLPNGTMMVVGKRRRLVADEQRTLVVSGIIRQVDIRPDNTILSQYVANFQVEYEGCGPESHFSNQGWAGMLLNRIWPF